MSATANLDPGLHFLRGGGSMGELLQAYPWASTSLGLPQEWPPALKTLVGVMLGSNHAMFIAWGDEHTLLYNDAYSAMLGMKHPNALGRSALDVWGEVRNDLIPMFEQVWAGNSVHMADITLLIDRRGFPEEAHFAFSYTPIRDDAGQVQGLFCASAETTGQVLAERRLREDTERQRRLFAQAPGFIAILQGPEHVFEFVNRTYIRLFGDRNFVGRPVREVFPDLLGQGFFELLDEVYRTAERFVARDVAVHIAPLGEQQLAERFLDLVYEPITNESGVVTGIFVEGHDVTETHVAQHALRASEMRFSALTQALPNQVWTAEPDGRLVWFNDRVHMFSGIAAQDLDGASWAALIHSEDRLAAEVHWRRALASGSPYETELRLRRYDGVYRWHLARVVPIFDAEGDVIRWLGTSTDINDQKAVANTLQQLNETLEERVAERTLERDRVWRNSRDLLVIIGSDGVFRAVNPAWTEILGHSPEDVEGHDFNDFIWPDDRAHAHRGLKAAALQNLSNYELRYRHANGSPRWISWHTSLEGDRIYAYGRDITAEKEQTNALQRIEEQLRQAQKMEAVGQLTGGIAHDFNNLLAGIVGSLDLIQARLSQGRIEQVERFAKSAMNSAQRAAALTHRLLAFARRQPLDPKALSANELLADMEELLRRTLGPLYQLQTFYSPQLWPTLCDPNQLESSILNLVLNARDAMPEGGKLVLQTANVQIEAGSPLHPQEMLPGEYVAIVITDSGLGMSSDVLKHVFEPFFTTKPLGQGTGLGLSMVYGFVRQSEGHVQMVSAPGEGTTVRIYLPRHSGEIPSANAANFTEIPRTQTGETVLLVEDEPIVRELILDILRDLGYRTLDASDGPSGLAILRSAQHIDLLISDIGLPGIDGRQLVEMARTVRPELKVLFITGYAESAAGVNGFLKPGMEMITKPFAVDMLATKVQSMIRA